MKNEPQSMELAPVEKQAVVKVPASQVDMQQLFMLAIEKGPDLVERVLAIQERMDAKNNKKAFDDAMAALQAEMPVVPKTKAVHNDSGVRLYNFAPFELVISHAKPYLQAHGFSYTLDTDVESKDGWVIAKCLVKHSGGHTEESVVKLPISSGTRAMSNTQVYAAALSFASRRAFCNAFGIVCVGEDIDGAGEKPKPKGPSKAPPQTPPPAQGSALEQQTEHDIYRKQLYSILKDHRGTEKSWLVANQFCRKHKIIAETEELPNISAERLRDACEKARIVVSELQN